MGVTTNFKVVLGSLITEEEAKVFTKSLTDEQHDYIMDSEFFHDVDPMCGSDKILGVSLYDVPEDGYGKLKSIDVDNIEDSLDKFIEPLQGFVGKLKVDDEDLYNKILKAFGESSTEIHMYVEYR